MHTKGNACKHSILRYSVSRAQIAMDFSIDCVLSQTYNSKMSWLDLVPGVAHVKAVAQLVTGDREGASRTAHRFITKVPIISHVASVVATLYGDDKLAEECWNGGNSRSNALSVAGDDTGGDFALEEITSPLMSPMGNVLVVGSAKDGIHYAADTMVTKSSSSNESIASEENGTKVVSETKDTKASQMHTGVNEYLQVKEVPMVQYRSS